MSAGSDTPGRVDRDDVGRVAVLTLTRPGRHNAFGPDMSSSLLAQLAAVNGDDGIRAIVLTGAGTSFCSGADIGSARAHTVESVGDAVADLGPGGQFFQALIDSPKPIVCVSTRSKSTTSAKRNIYPVSWANPQRAARTAIARSLK